jgi:hypothetical protein
MDSDPIFLSGSNDILEQIYQDGYSAVAMDASKLFYQFTTHPNDHPFLGLLHPVTCLAGHRDSLPSSYYEKSVSGSWACHKKTVTGLGFLRLALTLHLDMASFWNAQLIWL